MPAARPRRRRPLALGLALAALLTLSGLALTLGQWPPLTDLAGQLNSAFTAPGPQSATPAAPSVPAVARVPRIFAAACSGGDRNVAGNNVVVNQDEWLCGSISAYGGDVTVLGRVGSNATAVGGDVTVSGEVDGNVTAIGGNVTLLPDALVAGDVQAWGGRIVRAPSAVVNGSVGHMGQQQSFIQPDSWYFFPGHGIPWLNLIFWALAGTGIAYFFPTQLIRVERMARARLGESLLIGLAALLVGALASVILFFTCVGIPVALLLIVGLWALSVFGTVALGLWLGELLWRNAAYRQRSSFVLASVIGTLLLALPAEIPCVGGLVRIAVTAAGLGAASLTLYHARSVVGYHRV
jgi:hypothetical protein